MLSITAGPVESDTALIITCVYMYSNRQIQGIRQTLFVFSCKRVCLPV